MANGLHLDIEFLRAIARGQRNPGDLATVALAHLFELCSTCRTAFESWRRELGEGVADPFLGDYDFAFEGTRSGAAAKVAAVEAEEAAARELLALAPEERAERVRLDPGRYAGAALADLLLDEARRHLPGRPRDAHSVAILAQAVLQHTRQTPYADELYARTLAHQGNALRALGELRQADPLFQAARYLLKPQGGGDRLTKAEIDAFEGSLRRAQRRFEEAEELLRRSVVAYRMEERSTEAAEVLLRLGKVYESKGELERAIEVVTEADSEFATRGEPRLLLSRHNLAALLSLAGRSQEAREVFEASHDLYDRFPDPLTQLRRLWLEGHLARAEGALEAAEAAYRAVRDGFLRQRVGYDAALVALDLATVYAQQGRTGELKRLAEEIAPVFEAQDVHREAAAALLLFQDAVRAEQVTLRYLAELTRYLERARLDPTLPFRRPA